MPLPSGILDSEMAWTRHLMYIPAWQFPPQEGSGPGFAFVGSLNLGGLQMLNTGDLVYHTIRFPAQWDVTQTIGVRVYWTANGTLTAADDVDWIFLYDQVDPDEAIVDPATALDTAIATGDAYGSTTNNILKRSARGIIDADTFDEVARDGLFSFSVEYDAVTNFALGEVHLLGVEFDYIPQLTLGKGQTLARRIEND